MCVLGPIWCEGVPTSLACKMLSFGGCRHLPCVSLAISKLMGTIRPEKGKTPLLIASHKCSLYLQFLYRYPQVLLGAGSRPSRRKSVQTLTARAVCSASLHSCAAEAAQGEDFQALWLGMLFRSSSEELLSSPMTRGRALTPWFLLLSHGVHPGMPACALKTRADICTEKNPRDKRSTRSPGAGSRKASSLTRLPHTFAFYWLWLTSPSMSLKLPTINQLQLINSALLKNKT